MDRFIRFIVWLLPPKFLLWAVIRGFADATTGKNSNKHVDDLRYKDVYDSIVEKYGLKGDV